MPSTFLICPVRGGKEHLSEEIVKSLEKAGLDVHWPPRDTPQEDETGLNICTMNYRAIFKADMVHIVWDGESQGSLFDLGVAFSMYKRVVPICLPRATVGKSFQNMIVHSHVERELCDGIHKRTTPPHTDPITHT